jgi:cytochrome P450
LRICAPLLTRPAASAHALCRCPYYTRTRTPPCAHPYGKYNDARFAPNVPPQYGCQVQGLMGYFNSHLASVGALPRPLNKCWFFVWLPLGTWVTLLPFDHAFYHTFLFPKLRDFYFKRLLPAMVHKANGLLAYNAATRVGEIVPRGTLQALV